MRAISTGVLLMSLVLGITGDARAELGFAISGGIGRATIKSNPAFEGSSEISIRKVELYAWRFALPMYVSVGVSLGRAAEQDGFVVSARDPRFRANAKYIDCLIGARVPIGNYVAGYCGIGPTWLTDGFVSFEEEGRMIWKPALSSHGGMIALGIMILDPKGPVVHAGFRLRNITDERFYGDYYEFSNIGGPEYSIGIGWNFKTGHDRRTR